MSAATRREKTREELKEENRRLRNLAMRQHQQLSVLYNPYMYFVLSDSTMGIYFTFDEVKDGIHQMLDRATNTALANAVRRYMETNLTETTVYLDMFEKLPIRHKLEFFRVCVP